MGAGGDFTARLCAGTQRATTAELIEIAAGLAAAGYRGVELHPHQLGSAMDRAFRERLAAALADAGLRAPSAYVGVISDPPSIALAGGYCEIAAALGAELVFAVPPSRRLSSLEQTASCVRELAGHASTLGLTVAVHNHAGTSVTTVDEILLALERSGPGTTLCLDIAHLALFAEDLAGEIAVLAPHVGYVHFKDLEPWAREELARLGGDSLEQVAPLTPAYTDLGAGGLDLPGALAALAGVDDVWVTIEMETLRAPSVLEQSIANAEAYRALAAGAVAGAGG